MTSTRERLLLSLIFAGVTSLGFMMAMIFYPHFAHRINPRAHELIVPSLFFFGSLGYLANRFRNSR